MRGLWTLPLVLAAPLAEAGAYVMPRLEWGAYAPRPVADEATPNLYGYGVTLSGGYSIRQALDLGVFYNDLPGTLAHAKIGKGDASLVSYGGELGLRFAESVYLGFKGGLSTYKLATASEADELSGTWTGPSGGFALGAVSRSSKTGFWQTTIEVMHHMLTAKSGGEGRRRLDSFSLGVAYMWNSKGDGSSAIETTIFKNFLDSIVFF